MFISTEELKEKIDNKENIFLLDVRQPEEYNEWKIDGAVNIPLYQLKERVSEVPKDKEIVTICAHGQRSQMAATFLQQSEFKAYSMVGGMSAWNTVYEIVPIYYKDNHFGLYQMKRIGKGCLSYLLVSQEKMCVIDPSVYADKFLDMAKRFFVPITDVIETHLHADHISGALKLSKLTNANLYLNSEEDYSFSNFIDTKQMEEITIGNTKIKIIHTPGHTLGSVSLLIDNKFLLSGDTLFIDGSARADLGGDFSMLNESQKKLFSLPESITVLPSHYKPPIEFVVSDILGDLKQKYVLNDENTDKPDHVEDIVNINRSGEDIIEDEAMELEFGANKCVKY